SFFFHCSSQNIVLYFTIKRDFCPSFCKIYFGRDPINLIQTICHTIHTMLTMHSGDKNLLLCNYLAFQFLLSLFLFAGATSPCRASDTFHTIFFCINQICGCSSNYNNQNEHRNHIFHLSSHVLSLIKMADKVTLLCPPSVVTVILYDF